MHVNAVVINLNKRDIGETSRTVSLWWDGYFRRKYSPRNSQRFAALPIAIRPWNPSNFSNPISPVNAKIDDRDQRYDTPALCALLFFYTLYLRAISATSSRLPQPAAPILRSRHASPFVLIWSVKYVGQKSYERENKNSRREKLRSFFWNHPRDISVTIFSLPCHSFRIICPLG